MRRIARLPLEPTESAALRRLTKKVQGAADPKRTAASLWRAKNAATFAAIRKKLDSMAAGRARCMYCEDSFGTDIEHFYPKATYPKQAFTWTNYLLACSHCNSNKKRDRFPFISLGPRLRTPALLNPTSDDPGVHLAFLPTSGEYRAIGPKGQPSIDVFGLNDTAVPRKLPQARRAVFLKLQLLLEEYARCIESGNVGTAELARQVVHDEPFPEILLRLLEIANEPAATSLLRPGMPALLSKYSIAAWAQDREW